MRIVMWTTEKLEDFLAGVNTLRELGVVDDVPIVVKRHEDFDSIIEYVDVGDNTITNDSYEEELQEARENDSDMLVINRMWNE